MDTAEVLNVARKCTGTLMHDTKGFVGTGFVIGPICHKGSETINEAKKLKLHHLSLKHALCTCKHVIDAVPVDALWFNTYSEENRHPRRVIDVQKEMTPPVHWYRHPTFGVDVAVTRFHAKTMAAVPPALSPGMVALKEELRLGQRIYVIGFPSGIGSAQGMSSISPIVKHGIVANLDLSDQILIDIQVQGGNSGSMMLAEFPGEENPLRIAGVVTSLLVDDPHVACAFPTDCILDCIYKTDLPKELPEEEKEGFAAYRDENWPKWK